MTSRDDLADEWDKGYQVGREDSQSSARNQAWEEGYNAGKTDVLHDLRRTVLRRRAPGPSSNPYRDGE